MEFPFTRADGDVVRDDAVWSTWDAGFGDWDVKVDEFRDNLAQLAGIGFVCASDDEIEVDPARVRVPRRPTHRRGHRSRVPGHHLEATTTPRGRAPSTPCCRSWRRTSPSAACPAGRLRRRIARPDAVATRARKPARASGKQKGPLV